MQRQKLTCADDQHERMDLVPWPTKGHRFPWNAQAQAVRSARRIANACNGQYGDFTQRIETNGNQPEITLTRWYRRRRIRCSRGRACAWSRYGRVHYREGQTRDQQPRHTSKAQIPGHGAIGRFSRCQALGRKNSASISRIIGHQLLLRAAVNARSGAEKRANAKATNSTLPPLSMNSAISRCLCHRTVEKPRRSSA